MVPTVTEECSHFSSEEMNKTENRTSLGIGSVSTEYTKSNSYRILAMNLKSILEKRLFMHVVSSFCSIKYFKSEPSEISKITLSKSEYGL